MLPEIESISAQKPQKNNFSKKKRVMKLGASVVKDLNAWNLLQKARNCKFSLTSFPGAKVDFILNRLSGKT